MQEAAVEKPLRGLLADGVLDLAQGFVLREPHAVGGRYGLLRAKLVGEVGLWSPAYEYFVGDLSDPLERFRVNDVLRRIDRLAGLGISLAAQTGFWFCGCP